MPRRPLCTRCHICVKPACARDSDRVSVFQAAKLAKMKIPPSEMFLSESDKYSKFDENVRMPFVFRTWVDPLHLGRQELPVLGGLFCVGCALRGGGAVYCCGQRPVAPGAVAGLRMTD